MANTITGAIPGYSRAQETGSDSGSATEVKKDLANKDIFMKLLVEQLKNQDPLNPMDGTQFVAQLAQFSQLEQVIQIREDVGKLAGVATPADESQPAAATA